MVRNPASLDELLAGLSDRFTDPIGGPSTGPTMLPAPIHPGAPELPEMMIGPADVSGMDPRSFNPQPRNDQPKRGGKEALLQMAALMMPMLMSGRGSRSAAMMQGFLRGQERRRAEGLQESERDRDRKEKVAMLVRQAASDAQQFEDPEQFTRYLDAYGQVIQGVDPSFNPATLRSAVAFPASKLAKKRQAEAAAKITELKTLYGENFDQVAQTASVTFNGKPTKVSDLLSLAEMSLTTDKGPVSIPPRSLAGAMSDREYAAKLLADEFAEVHGRPPNAAERRALWDKAQAQKPGAGAGGGVDDQLADLVEVWKARNPGKPVTPEIRAQLRVQAKKEMGQADDRPRVTVDVGGLNPRVQTAVSSVQRRYEANPTVRRTAVMAEAVDFVNSLSNSSNNPADDQALIYAFAKAMDPDSVVREGEYATVQKYSQSWISSWGFNAQRVVSNSEFLSPQVRQNLKATILKKFAANRTQYDNVRRQMGNELSRLTGQKNGQDFLIDYSPSSVPGESAPQPAGGPPAAAAPPPRPRGQDVKWSKSLNAWVQVTGQTADGKPIVRVVK